MPKNAPRMQQWASPDSIFFCLISPIQETLVPPGQRGPIEECRLRVRMLWFPDDYAFVRFAFHFSVILSKSKTFGHRIKAVVGGSYQLSNAASHKPLYAHTFPNNILALIVDELRNECNTHIISQSTLSLIKNISIRVGPNIYRYNDYMWPTQIHSCTCEWHYECWFVNRIGNLRVSALI